MSKLRSALKNEYVKSVILLAIILGGIVGSWFGLRVYFATDYPMLAVASGSMIPTLNVGDLIVVQGGFRASDILAAYGTGDIIVFHKPNNLDELIVHRAVEKFQVGDAWYIRTRGDNNNSPDPWQVSDSELVGKVVGTIPYIGHVPLFVHTPTGITLILILIMILILLEFVLPFSKEKKKPEPEQPKEESDVSGTNSP